MRQADNKRCDIHPSVAFKRLTKDGLTWYSHWASGKWCHGFWCDKHDVVMRRQDVPHATTGPPEHEHIMAHYWHQVENDSWCSGVAKETTYDPEDNDGLCAVCREQHRACNDCNVDGDCWGEHLLDGLCPDCREIAVPVGALNTT